MLKIREKILSVNLYQRPVSVKNTGFKPNFTGSDSFISSTQPLSFDSVKEAETYAKENLGVKAKFGDDLILANLVVDGLDDVIKAGFILPKGASVRVDYLLGNDPRNTEHDVSIKLVPASTSTNPLWPEIYLNPKYPWKDNKDRMSKRLEENWFVTDNPKHFIHHEVGHLLHVYADSDIHEKSIERKPTGKDKELIEEYFAIVKILGTKLPKEAQKLDKLYKEWNGPEPNSSSSLKSKLKKLWFFR